MLAHALFALVLNSAAMHPLVSDDTGTQGARRVQVEMAAEGGRDKPEPGHDHSRWSAASTLAFGVRESLDAQLSLPLERTLTEQLTEEGALAERAEGLGDAVVELKWRFFERGGSSLALKPGLSLPTGDYRKGLGSGEIAGRGALLATQRIGRFAVHANAAYAYNNNREGERLNLWRVSAAGELGLGAGFRTLLDVGAERSAADGEPHPAFGMAGIIFSPAAWLDLDAGVKRGLNRSEEDLTWLVGSTLRF